MSPKLLNYNFAWFIFWVGFLKETEWKWPLTYFMGFQGFAFEVEVSGRSKGLIYKTFTWWTFRVGLLKQAKYKWPSD